MKTLLVNLRLGLSALAFVLALCGLAVGDVIVASDRAAQGVQVRQRASSDSRSVGILAAGEEAELISSVPRWHRVKLSNGVTGYVSKSWTELRANPTAAAPAPSPAPVPAPTPSTASGAFTVHIVDVGTGLGTIIEGADFVVVFDAGSQDDVAQGDRNRMLAYMRKVLPAVRRIDHLMLSHPHKDHVQLLPDIVRAYDVSHVWDSGAVNDTCAYRLFIAAVEAKAATTYHSAKQGNGTFPVRFTQRCRLPGSTTHQIVHGARISDGPIQLGRGATMTILHADAERHGTDFNRNTLVVRFDLGGKRVLMMGDAEAGGRQSPEADPSPSSIEGKLLAGRADVKADVLVVGHHGSKTSSRKKFLDAVGASTFVVSSGPFPYHRIRLPDAEVTSELESRGTLFRTDLNDRACRTNRAKIGPDNDDKPGGCDNVHISIRADQIQTDYWRGAD